MTLFRCNSLAARFPTFTAVLVTTFSAAALDVVTTPGSNTSPAGTVSVMEDIIDIPEFPLLIINRLAKFSGTNAGTIGGTYVFRSTADPAVASYIGASQFGFYQDNNGVGSFLNGAESGDDNWVFINLKVDDALVYNGWVKVSITDLSFSPILYVYDAANPTALISLPDAVAAANAPIGSPRDVQIKSVDFVSGIIELHNFGAGDQDLDGWRFCTHDESEAFKYTAVSGLNGVTIESGTSLNIHFNNDAPVVNVDNLNRSSLGGVWAGPLDASAYGMALYRAGSFGSGADMVDYAQWSLGGAGNATADERADEAVAGGVWSSVAQWIPTSERTSKVYLTDASAAELHGASDYLVLPDFGITSISRNAATNQVSLSWPTVNNLEVVVESTGDLEAANWPDQETTSGASALLGGQTDAAAFYRLLFTLP